MAAARAMVLVVPAPWPNMWWESAPKNKQSTYRCSAAENAVAATSVGNMLL